MFEKLEVWKRACRLSTSLYRELDSLKNWGFRDQITRSGLSIPSNIAEAKEISAMLGSLIKRYRSKSPKK